MQLNPIRENLRNPRICHTIQFMQFETFVSSHLTTNPHEHLPAPYSMSFTSGTLLLTESRTVAAAHAEIAMALLNEHAAEQDTRLKLIDRCGLSEFLWQLLAQLTGVPVRQQSLGYWEVDLFEAAFQRGVGSAPISPNGAAFLGTWQDSSLQGEAFKTLSTESVTALRIDKLVKQTGLDTLASITAAFRWRADKR